MTKLIPATLAVTAVLAFSAPAFAGETTLKAAGGVAVPLTSTATTAPAAVADTAVAPAPAAAVNAAATAPVAAVPATTGTTDEEDATPEPEAAGAAPTAAVESYMMKDGTAIQVRGVQAVVVKADGTTAAAPDGEITTGDGKTMKVRGGVLIREEAATTAPVAAPAMTAPEAPKTGSAPQE